MSPVEVLQADRNKLSGLIDCDLVRAAREANARVGHHRPLHVGNATVEIHAPVKHGVEVTTAQPGSDPLKSRQQLVDVLREREPIGVCSAKTPA